MELDPVLPLPSQEVPLNFDSIQTTPESHSWMNSDEMSAKIALDKKVSLPLIDLLDDGASELVGKACEEWGMFYLINHGVPETLFVEAEAEARRFFALPTTQKMKILRSPSSVVGYDMAGISKYREKYMWQEGYIIIGSPIDNAKKLWPSDYKRFCDAIEEYYSKMTDLSDRLIRLMLKFLGIVVEEEILKLLSDSIKPHNTLRLNSYSPCPDPDQVVGLAAHTDTSLFTILHQTLKTNGLQIFKDGAWVSTCPTSGTLIVNVGDFLQILSNERFRSIPHRVIVQDQKSLHRLSLAYFYIPPDDLYVTPFVKPMSESPQFPLYRCVTVKQYFTIKTNNNGEGISAIKILSLKISN